MQSRAVQHGRAGGAGVLWVGLLFVLVSCGEEREPAPAPAPPLERQWLAAVRAGEAEGALALAAQICRQEGSKPPGRFGAAVHGGRYAKLLESAGLAPRYLDVGFNAWDFRLWSDAVFFHDAAREIAGEKAEPLPALFKAVTEQLRGEEGEDEQVPWPRRVWERGYGLCDRQAWVLAELAYQSGWEPQIVYLHDPETKVSPHTVCELRRGGEVAFADPLFGKLLAGRSVADVAADAGLAARLWPKRPKLVAAVTDCIWWTPAYAQDYCVRNQLLQDRLRSKLGAECPRFGEDPMARLTRYHELAGDTDGAGPSHRMRLWFYPVRLLAGELRREAVRRGEESGGR
jgi:hypothetical protein